MAAIPQSPFELKTLDDIDWQSEQQRASEWIRARSATPSLPVKPVDENPPPSKPASSTTTSSSSLSTPPIPSSSSSSSSSSPTPSLQSAPSPPIASSTSTSSTTALPSPPLPRLPILATPVSLLIVAPQKVNQLDAEQLDSELISMLRYQVLNVFRYFRSDLIDSMKPELDAFLSFLIYRFSIYTNTPSPGNQLQNLRYLSTWAPTSTIPNVSASPSPSSSASLSLSMPLVVSNLSLTQRLLHGSLSIGGRWAWARLSQLMLDAGWSMLPQADPRHQLYRWIRRAEMLYRILAVLNFMAFLYNGRFRSLIDRFLGMRLAYLNPKLSRQVSFEFMNQQLVWHGLSEFLLFLLPLINVQAIKQSVARGLRWLLKQAEYLAGVGGGGPSGGPGHHEQGDGAVVNGMLSMQGPPEQNGCPVCQSDPITSPYVANCAHVFCYYCVAGSIKADGAARFCCPLCDEAVTKIERARPEQMPLSLPRIVQPPPPS